MPALRAYLWILLFAVVGPAEAQSRIEATQTCLADSTTGKDRKALARWIFLSIAAHPEMKELSSADAKDVEDASRYVGELFTRLVVEECADPMREMAKEHGTQSFEAAFGFLGQMAMKELMANQEVAATMSQFERYADMNAVSAALDDTRSKSRE